MKKFLSPLLLLLLSLTAQAFTTADTSLYPGGTEALKTFMNEHFKYYGAPDKLKSKNVCISFEIGSDGKPTQVTPVGHQDDPLKGEMVRLVNLSSGWSLPEKEKQLVHLVALFSDKGVPQISEVKILSRLAEYPEGELGLQRFLAKNIRYPKSAFGRVSAGTVNVLVLFMVDETGKVTNVKATSDEPGYGFEEEAKAVVKRFERWMPALDENGKPARMPFSLPVRFKSY